MLDEAKWGLDWLIKMNPQDDWMFNQLADDRDHQGMRIPKEDSFYGKGYERPVYFCTGEPQGLGKYKNLQQVLRQLPENSAAHLHWVMSFLILLINLLQTLLQHKSVAAYQFGLKKPGVCQTAPNRAPYFYEEDNWVDDMELAAINLFDITSDQSYLDASFNYAEQEKITPWLGADTAHHYQWYPFINLGHYELAKKLKGAQQKQIISYYKEGIERVWQKAKQNGFYRGIPFIWCSNNLTTSFAIQCYWYRTLSGDDTYTELEQACFDWLFGCNPWGTSMVYGLPSWGDTPTDPHSSFTQIGNYPIDGGLVDGPVYGSIYNNLLGVTLHQSG